MNKSETKVQRLLQIEALLLDHPEGLSQSDIARRLGVNRSTIHRYLPDLTQHTPVFEEDGRLFIDRKSYLVNLKLNLYEALSLHLATRLLTNRMERQNPHSASLMRKLAINIEKLSPQISKHLSKSADVADDPSRFQDPHYISILESLTLAWAEGRQVKIWHRHTETNQIYKYLFCVYFIEPHAVGYAVHTIGLRTPPGEIRTFNLARIERVERTNLFYSIPNDFDPTSLLKQAWGIWYAEGNPELVRLRFSSKVADRVLETRWHLSQKTTKEVDGALMWEAMISEPKEMIPWIRGWGSDCEVISPASLRYKLVNEIATMHEIYIRSIRPLYMEFWAKFTRKNELEWHSLLWHLVDTAAVTKLLWNDCLSLEFKKSLSRSFGLSVDDMGVLLMFWIGLHDIGKAGPEFQKKNRPRQDKLEKLGFVFPTSRFKIDGFHATATTLMIERVLSEEVNMPKSFRISLAKTLGGHHGEFPDDHILNKSLTEVHHVGDEKWQTAQEQIYSELAKFLEIPVPRFYPEENSEMNPILMLIAGLTTVADWIASNERYFPFLNADLPISEYFPIAETQAKKALTHLGWYGWKSDGSVASFQDLFSGFTPNQIQQTVIDHFPNLQSPFLAIIEAPTGSGKTEAAFYLADAVTQRDQKAGIYIAMPTQATSNQMYNRTANFLAHRYSEEKINLHLVHGAASLNDQAHQFEPTNIWGDDLPDYSNIHAHSWFLSRKKTLLAPFGVGTVDQTFLSVLKSRHFFLRLFGLSHKVLIFDEVHAYDIYMTRIFKSLLHWLQAVGTSVIILSATLPASTRQELMTAYGANNMVAQKVDFPRISAVTQNTAHVIQAGAFPSRAINLGWIDKDPKSILIVLKESLTDGGCAAVICNTVHRAQEVYDVINERFNDETTEIILFHSRFPHCWRKEIEDHVVSMFGKETNNRPHRAIVIATQVIEQSLDLDFDLMITDLAPIDLLIQRMGRLHRHNNAQSSHHRPKGLENPRCIISAPAFIQDEKLPDFGPDGYVYEPYILLKTLIALNDRNFLELPKETDALIEDVYAHEELPSLSEELTLELGNLRDAMLKHNAESESNANNYLIPLSSISILGSLKSSYSDDIEGLSKNVIKTPTREILPTIQIVCLTQDDDGLRPLDSTLLVNLEEPLTREQANHCLRASTRLTNFTVVNYFLNNMGVPPESFRKSAALRWHFPVVFKEGTFITKDFTLHLDRKRGILVKTNK